MNTTSIPEWLPAGVNALQSFLKDHRDAEKKLSEILDSPLANPDANTKDIVATAISNYFGQEVTDLLDNMMQSDLEGHLQEYSEIIPPESMKFLSKFVSLYVPKLKNLIRLTNPLVTFLKSHPDANHQVQKILDKYLTKIDATTWNSMGLSLDNYWSQENTDILFDVAQAANQESRLQEIKDLVTPETMDFLRQIISLYGPELGNAYLAANQLPNNWKTFYRDVYYDYINKRYHIRIRLAKYNGEEPLIEGNIDSILELTTFMIQTLLFLPNPDGITQSLIDQFIQKSNELNKFLQPSKPEISSTSSDDKAAESITPSR